MPTLVALKEKKKNIDAMYVVALSLTFCIYISCFFKKKFF